MERIRVYRVTGNYTREKEGYSLARYVCICTIMVCASVKECAFFRREHVMNANGCDKILATP